MATVKSNSIMHGVSGKVGDVVYKQRGNKTYISKAPRKPDHIGPEHQESMHRFAAAARYARIALQDRALKMAYAAKAKVNQSAYNVAVADFFHAPTIEALDYTSYKGEPGNLLTIMASDDFQVAAVHVALLDNKGEVMESGEAFTKDGYQWIYVVQRMHASVSGTTIVVNALDHPKNMATKEYVIL